MWMEREKIEHRWCKIPIKDTVYKENRNAIARYADKAIGIKVGVFGEESSRKAYLQHYPENPNTPRAPFIIDEAEDNEDEIFSILSKIDIADAKKTLDNLGSNLAESMKKKIMYHSYAPNAEYTVKKKGFDHRLLEHGGMYESIAYKPLKGGD